MTSAASSSSSRRLSSFSDDSTVRVWDIATQEQVSKFSEHTDYVRAGAASETSEHLLVSGSYDHTVKLWDRRASEGASLTLSHGSPVEAVLLFPGDGLLASAGGHDVKVWDLLSGGKLLTKVRRKKCFKNQISKTEYARNIIQTYIGWDPWVRSFKDIRKHCTLYM